MTFLADPPRPASWSEAELAALGRALGGFVAGDTERMALLAATALEEMADPADLRQLRLAMRSFDHRLANLLLGAGPVRFRDLDEARADRYLLGWGTSRLAPRRTTFQALKRLALFLAYADPGRGSGPNPFWGPMGYRPSWAAPTLEPTPIRPLEVDRGPATSGTPLELEADVAIVGSGAGGGVVAARLAAAGRSVLVVEAGSAWPEAAMPTDELTGFERMFLDRGLTATHDLSVAILAGATLGGGMTVNWTTTIEPPPELRAAWTRQHGLDGFDGSEADADFARLRLELGVASPDRPAPKDRSLVEGCRALGYEAGPNERNVAGCTDCGGCTFGCRAGTKRAGLRGHLALAAEHGARFLVDAPVDRVTVDAGRATGLEGRLLVPFEGSPAGAGRPFRVRARQVVVAAGALRTPIVLLGSGSFHPWLGHGLRLHPVPAVAGRMTDRVDMWAGPLQSARSLRFLADGPAAAGYPGPAHGPFLIESAPPHPGLAGSAFPWSGRADSAAFMTDLGQFAPLIAIVADRGAGQVSRTRAGRVRIHYRLSPADARTANRALVEMARISRAAGASAIVAVGTPAAWFGRDRRQDERAFAAYLERLAGCSFAPNRTALFSAHQMGTARAGADPMASPCDPWGRVRSDERGRVVPGLYVGDASLFPTAIGVNPQLTVMALAERVARTVLAES